MKNKIIKKLIMSCLCMTLCFGTIQTNVMAAEIKNGQSSEKVSLVTIQDRKNTRQDVNISESDKEAALSNKLSSADLLKKYGSKGSNKPSKLLTTNYSLDSVTDSTGRNKLEDSFYFLNDDGAYGGNQNWLHGNGASTGCGPIAGCNVLAYHAKYYDRSNLYPYNWSKSDWIKYQNNMYDINGGIQTVNRFEEMLTFYAFSKGYNYRLSSQSYYRNTDENLTDMCNFIKDQIDSNNPVVMLIGTKSSGSTYKTDFALHWVTITGYTFWGNEADPYVRVSSWGDWYDLDLAELLAQRSWIDVAYAYES